MDDNPQASHAERHTHTRRRCKHCGLVLDAAATRADMRAHRDACQRAAASTPASVPEASRKSAPEAPRCRFCGRRTDNAAYPHVEADCLRTLPAAHRTRLLEGPNRAARVPPEDPVVACDRRLAALTSKVLVPLSAVQAKLAESADVWDACPHCGKRLTRRMRRLHLLGGSCIVAATTAKMDRLGALVDAWRCGDAGTAFDVSAGRGQQGMLERVLAPRDAALMEAQHCVAAIDAVVPIAAAIARHAPARVGIAAEAPGSPLLSLTFPQLAAARDDIQVIVSKWLFGFDRSPSEIPVPAGTTTPTPNAKTAEERAQALPSLRAVVHAPRLASQATRRLSPMGRKRVEVLAKMRTALAMGFNEAPPEARGDDGPLHVRRFSPETLRLARAVVGGLITIDEAVEPHRKRPHGGFAEAINPTLRH